MLAKLVVCWARAWPSRMRANMVEKKVVSPTPSLGNIVASVDNWSVACLFSAQTSQMSLTEVSPWVREKFALVNSCSFWTFVHDYQSACIMLQSKHHYWHAMRLVSRKFESIRVTYPINRIDKNADSDLSNSWRTLGDVLIHLLNRANMFTIKCLWYLCYHHHYCRF